MLGFSEGGGVEGKMVRKEEGGHECADEEGWLQRPLGGNKEWQRVDDLGFILLVVNNRSTADSTSGPGRPSGAQTQHYHKQTHLLPTKSAASDFPVLRVESPLS